MSFCDVERSEIEKKFKPQHYKREPPQRKNDGPMTHEILFDYTLLSIFPQVFLINYLFRIQVRTLCDFSTV
jgi:hypothetical protein